MNSKQASPEEQARNERFRFLMKRYPCLCTAENCDFAAVPEAVIRQFARDNGMTEDDALARYGWWAEGGHRWQHLLPPEQRSQFKVGDRVIVTVRDDA